MCINAIFIAVPRLGDLLATMPNDFQSLLLEITADSVPPYQLTLSVNDRGIRCPNDAV